MPTAYLTGDSEPTGYVTYRLRIPDVEWFRKCVHGSLLDLIYSYNWEQVGTVTPDEAAELGMLMFDDYMNSLAERVGTIFWCLLEEVPESAHELDGSTLSDADDNFPILWDRIDPSFKSGSNIVLPDYRGRFFRVPGGSVDPFDTGGDFAITLAEANIPPHKHSISVYPVPALASGAGPVSVVTNAPSAGLTGSTGSGDEVEFMPEFAAPRCCIWLE